MKSLVALCLLAFVAAASAQCTCNNLKWAVCNDPPCACSVPVGQDEKLTLDCSKLIPKCFLMKAHMYRARRNESTRSIGGKPVETAFVDNDGVYDPVCESDGRFKAIQCNNTETCWCVNSAGVRRSDKADKNIKCEPVETIWVRLQMTHKPVDGPVDLKALTTGIGKTLDQRYNIAETYVKEVKYDKDARMIVVDVKKEASNSGVDLSRMAYYLEKDVKEQGFFAKPVPGLPLNAAGTDVPLQDILVYYVDEKPPTFTMKTLTGGVIAVIVVVVLVVVIGLLVLFFLRKREARFRKGQPREMEAMSS